MPTVKAFWQDDCPHCPQMKHIAKQLKEDGFEVEYFDLSTVDGLAEGAYYSVMGTPTMLLVDKEDNELAEWRGIVPSLAEVKDELNTVLEH